jgi:hypothetical protein
MSRNFSELKPKKGLGCQKDIIPQNIWTNSYDIKAGKDMDYHSTSTKPEWVYCICQSTIMWRDENCRIAILTHNFRLASTAMYLK